MRLGQSAAAAATPTRALPLATSTKIVAFHAAEKRSDDQWYKSMSRSSPASATHVHLHVVMCADASRNPVDLAVHVLVRLNMIDSTIRVNCDSHH